MLTRGDRNLKLNVILRNRGSGLEHLPFFLFVWKGLVFRIMLLVTMSNRGVL